MKITVLTLGRGINGDALRLLFVSCEQVIAYNKFPGIVILLGRYTLSIFIASFGDLVWFVLFPLLPFHFIVNKESLLETGVILSLKGTGKIPIGCDFSPVCLQIQISRPFISSITLEAYFRY